jgi:exosortase
MPVPLQFAFAVWLKCAFVLTLVGLLYADVIKDLAIDWWTDPGLSQGMLLPPLAMYVAWLRRWRTLSSPAVTDDRGLAVVGLSSVVFLAGKFGAEFFLLRIAFVILLAGITWTYWGYPRLRSLALPFLLLTTMIPLPKVVYNSVSTPLQLFASGAAATIVRNFDVTVYHDGNIISLANITLGVEEACSGLHSLSSLVVAGSLLGAIFCRRLRSRLLLIAMSIPLAVCVNVLRITVTALLADNHPRFAVGFYHLFSGWLVFVVGFLSLYLLSRILHASFD